ncbi:MAG: hypothetical protein IT437_10235 [Phycisphaerales bacterium]|nr:hypothetical protein [Phycisphaerales bacterium]
MKLKGVSTFEQYVEKIVLAVVSVVLLGVVAMQVLLQPNQIKVGNGPLVPPGQAYYAVRDRANAVKGKLNDTMPAGRPDVSPQPLAQKFEQAFQAPVAPEGPRVAFGMPLSVTGTEVAAQQGSGSVAPIAPVAVPAPTGAVAVARWSTLDPAEVVNNAELRNLVGAEQPFDKASVSVEATFDGAALKRALLTDPDGDTGPVRAVPSQWWSQMEIFGVRLEREELTDTGEWTGLTRVAALPGRQDLAAEMTKQAVSVGDLDPWLAQAQQYSNEVRRPEFYRVVAGRQWMPPTEAAKLGGAGRSQELDQEMRRRARLLADRDRFEAALAARGAARPNQGEPGGGGGGRGKAIGSGGGRTGQPEAQPKADPVVANLERQLKSTEDEIAKVDEKILAMGFDPETGMARAPEGGDGDVRSGPLLDDARVQVWTHDLTAEPGKTYRYRLTVLLNNPAFGRGASMVPEQQELAKKVVVESTPSEWTAPVPVPPRTALFITSANEGTDFGSQAGATVEVYQMFYGYYRRGSARVEPGDAVVADVDLPKKIVLPIWDVEKLKSADPNRPASAPQPGRAVAPADIILPPGRGPARTAPGSTPRPGEEVQPAPLPEGATAWNKPIVVSLETVLLDVARKPVVIETGLGAAKTRYEAFLRRPTGQIEVRVPDDDRESDLYRRVTASAKEGETQGQPVAPTEPRRTLPMPGERPRPGSGGGGGMGGG